MAEADDYDQCSFILVSPLHDTTVKARKVTETQRDFLFDEAFSRIKERDDTETASLLKRLEKLSPATAAYFESKAKQTKNFVFRLIYPDKEPSLEKKPSYVAISYRWAKKASLSRRSYSSDAPGDVGDERVFTALPISDIFQSAMFQELQSTCEGIWCDQICIDQDNEEEKAISIGLMDLIYQEARCVVIPLADIKINEAEHEFLESYIPEYLSIIRTPEAGWKVPNEYSNPPYMESHPILYEILIKIFQSEWFGRAWCCHEMYMGKRHLFFVSCESKGKILRFSGHFLVHLCILSLEISNRPSLLRELVRSSILGTTVFAIMKSEEVGENLLETFRSIRNLIASGDPFLSGLRRERSALRDKMAITLNVAKCNVVLNSNPYVKFEGGEENFRDDSWHKISLLSLAAKDALILGTTGDPMPSQDTSQKRCSWLRHFETRDKPPVSQPRGGVPLLDNSSFLLNPENSDEYIDLLLTVFDPSSMVIDPSKTTVSLALEFIKLADQTSSYAVRLYYKWRNFVQNDKERRRLFTLTVACLLHNGIGWILSCLSVTLNTDEFSLQTEACLRAVYHSGLPNCDLPASAEAVAKTVAEWMETVPGSCKAANIVLQFAIYLLQEALPMPWTADSIKEYQPRVISTSSKKYIIFRTPRNSLSHMVIPQALLGDGYFEMNRLWFIEFLEMDGKAEWTLLGRTRIFGPSICDQMKVVRRLKIFGPSIESRSLNS